MLDEINGPPDTEEEKKVDKHDKNSNSKYPKWNNKRKTNSKKNAWAIVKCMTTSGGLI